MTAQQIKQRVDTTSDEIDLGKLFGLLLDGKWIILATTTFFAIFGIAFALLSTPIYKADALIQIEQKGSGGISSLVGGEMSDLFSSESSATTEIEIIKSRMILGDTVHKFNLTTLVEPDYFPVIGKGIARLRGQINRIQVSRLELPSYAWQTGHQIVVQDAEQKTYQLVREDGRVILSGKVGELAKNDDYQLFVSDLDANSGFAFNISKQSELDAIKWLKDNLSV
ncbi:Wzz/FepE/Etk N-terminal domain-containing protein, partial [Vibrio anguillarum]